jgi:hypothetical protein
MFASQKAYGSCRGVNAVGLAMTIEFRASVTPERASLTHPSFALRDGGPVPDEVSACLRSALGPELSFPVEAGRQFPPYDGTVELNMNMGTADRDGTTGPAAGGPGH